MRAIGYAQSLPIAHEQALFEFECPRPDVGPRDLLVRIHAIGMNPLDGLDRMRRAGTLDKPLVLGWDAAGVVAQVGAEVSLFKPGDAVYYSGSVLRQGSNAEYGVVDERLAALKPRTLSFKQAAAVPLTAITAWECLFDRLRVPTGAAPQEVDKPQEAVLMIGAAGGVGSIAVQLARRLTPLHVIGTASRPASQAWVRELGAHEIIDHSRSLSQELARIGRPSVRYILSFAETTRHWDEIAACIAPQGGIAIVDIPEHIDVLKVRRKAVGIHFELMMVRAIYPGQDMDEIHRLLTKVAALIDEGSIRSTVAQDYGPMSVAGLRRAHQALESQRTIGKIVLGGLGLPD